LSQRSAGSIQRCDRTAAKSASDSRHRRTSYSSVLSRPQGQEARRQQRIGSSPGSGKPRWVRRFPTMT
jgi:hypothetical protein